MNNQPENKADTFKYPYAARFNFRELGTAVIFAAFLAVFLVIPFMVKWIAGAGGLNLDTFKEIPEGIDAVQLLPDASLAISVDRSETGAESVYQGNAQAVVFQYPDHASAVTAWESRSGGASTSGGGKFLRRGKREELHFVEWVNGPFMMALTAPDKPGVERLIGMSDYIDMPGEPGYGAGKRPFIDRLIMDYPVLFALGLDVLIVLFLWGIFAGGIALATRRPEKGAPRISRDGLRDQLLALNHEDSEFVIEEAAPYHLVGRWKYEVPKYRSLFSEHGMSEAYQLDLYLNPDGPVGALETRGSISWDRNLVPPGAGIRWNYFRGIVLFEKSSAKVWAVDPGDLRLKKVVDFNFDVRQYKEPVAQVVTSNGWRLRPIMLRPLIWRG